MANNENAKKRKADSQRRVARIQELVCQLGRLLEDCDQVCLTKLNVTVAQGYAIMMLPKVREVTMTDLSEAIGVTGSTATRMVDQLIRRQWVARRNDPKDRRIVRVALTSQGRKLRRELENAIQSCFLGAFADVPEEKQISVVEALELVNALLTKSLAVHGCEGCETS